jgi:molecular chaperone DnaJ
MSNSQDYYSLLGVSKTSSADEIKKAYRKLALQYHPDRNKTKEADVKFKEITKAYEVLSDPQKKQMYDTYGAQAFEQGAGGMGGNPFSGGAGGQYGPFRYSYSSNGQRGDFDFGGFSDPFEIFEQFFGGASPFGQQARRPLYSIRITFMEAIQGVEKSVTIDGKNQKIKIPAGVDSGSRIRFTDYDILIDVMPDKKFQREGYDIVTEQEISFPQAALGDELQVQTVQGEVKIRVPAGTQPNTLIRLSGKGVPYLRQSGKGDHYVKIKVTVPKSLSKREKELLEELRGEGTAEKKSWF